MHSFIRIALKATLWIGGILLVVAGVLKVFFIDIVVMGHDGMAPTILAGEEVLMWRGADDPEVGDILVCHHPTHATQMVMGRVIGKSGMEVSTDRGQLFVSGTSPQRDVLNEDIQFYNVELNRPLPYTLSQDTFGNTTHYALWPTSGFRIRETSVGANNIYLLGDNRGVHANDSRSFGAVPAMRCVGRMFMRLKPVENDRGAGIDRGWLDLLD